MMRWLTHTHIKSSNGGAQMLEQWLNTVQQEMSIYTVWITGSDVTGSGVQRNAVFSHELDHGTGLRLRSG